MNPYEQFLARGFVVDITAWPLQCKYHLAFSIERKKEFAKSFKLR